MGGADNVCYKDLLLVAKVIDGKLDFPYPIFWFNCALNNQTIYDIKDVPNDTEVLANVHVSVQDYEEAKKLPCVVDDFQNDPRVKAFWDVMEATEQPEVSPLDGKIVEKALVDGKEAIPTVSTALKPFCISNKMDTVSLVVDKPVILTEVKLNEKL